MNETQSIQKWYEQTWVIVLFLIFFFPVGLILMWKFANWSNTIKTIVTIVIALFFMFFVMMIFLTAFGIIGFLIAATDDQVIDNTQDYNTQEIFEEDESTDLNQEVPSGENELNSDEEMNESNADGSALDQMQIQFDDREWDINFEEEVEDGIFVREFLLEDETADDWNEVITLHFMTGLQDQPLKDFVDQMENEALQNGLDSNDVEIEILEESDDELIYEFQIKDGMLTPGRHELSRIMKADEGVYILHYANADVPMADDKKDEWLKLLQQAKVK